MAVYTYDINITAAGTVRCRALHRQLRRDIREPDGVTLDGTTAYVHYTTDLNSTEQTSLDAIMAAHDATPFTDEDCKIYDYLNDFRGDKTAAPKTVDYVRGLTIKLFPKRTMVQGEIQKVEWYSDEALTDKIVQADIVYARDTAGFADSRTTTRTWYRKDGSAHPDTKLSKKLYSTEPMAKVAEGKRRRGNIIDHVEANVAGMLLATETGDEQTILDMGRNFINTYQSEIAVFIEASRQDIHAAVLADTTYAWLDNLIDATTTIRAWVLNELNIWGL